jgi:type I restriction-modification system DNA methylase subunit
LSAPTSGNSISTAKRVTKSSAISQSSMDIRIVSADRDFLRLAELAKDSNNYELVLTNPPFGKKSSITIINEEGEESREALTVYRDDFWATTSNKQLNFVQHVVSLLKMNGRAAVVVPDNVLFEGGAGETIRRNLLQSCDVHTLLRLPTGIFYAQGVKANVLFFGRKPASETPWTKWKIPITFPIRPYWPPRSSRTCKPRWTSSRRSPLAWQRTIWQRTVLKCPRQPRGNRSSLALRAWQSKIRRARQRFEDCCLQHGAIVLLPQSALGRTVIRIK